METSDKTLTIETFAKAKTITMPSPTQALVFETDRQRNASFIKKGITKPGPVTFEVLRRAARSVHIARICINVLKEKITKTKWVIKPIDPLDKGHDAEIEEVTELFNHPNKNGETMRSMLDKMLEDLLVLDCVSIEKTRYPDGKLAELFYVDSATIRPVFDEYGNRDILIPVETHEGIQSGMSEEPVSYVQVMNNSQYGGPESGEIVASWENKEFIYFHMHPQGAMEGIGYGLSPLEGVLSVVANLLNADNYNGTYFEEGAFPPIILQLIGQVNQRDLEAYRAYLTQELSGNFHKPAIMAGAQKSEVIKLKDSNNRDMEFMEYMKFMARLLAAAYGLSGQDIGLTDDLNKATSQVQKGLSEDKGYSSILDLLKDTFNQEIIWNDFGYEDIEFDWVADDSVDPKDAVDMYQKSLSSGIMTVNEARQKLGYEPFDKWADVPMVLTAGGYVPILSSDNPANDKEEEKTEPTQEKEESKENSEAKKETEETSQKSQKKSWVSKLFKGQVRKASIVEPKRAPTLETEFENTPVMFGTLVQDKSFRTKVNSEFDVLTTNELLKRGYYEMQRTNDFNTATTNLNEFIKKNPEGFGGIVVEKGMAGAVYCLYVRTHE